MTPSTSSILPAGTMFARYCKAIAIGKGDVLQAEAYAQARGWVATAADIHKSAVSPLTQADALATMKPYAIDLSNALRPLRIIGRLPLVRTVPTRTRYIAASVGASATFTAEGAPAPVSALSLQAPDSIEPAKNVAITVQTDELFRESLEGSQDLLRNDLLAACAQAEDFHFIAPDNIGGPGVPASITHAGAQIPSSGSTLANVDADLKALVSAHVAAGNSLETAVIVAPPRSLVHIGSLRGTGGDSAFPSIGARGGSIWGIPVLASAACAMTGSPTEGTISIIEQSQILVADDEQVDVQVTREAALQLSDTPSAGVAAQVALWQSGLIALRVTRWISWRARRPGAASSIIGINF